jgi:hypothetical protein
MKIRYNLFLMLGEQRYILCGIVLDVVTGPTCLRFASSLSFPLKCFGVILYDDDDEVIRHVFCTIRKVKAHSSSLLMTAAFLKFCAVSGIEPAGYRLQATIRLSERSEVRMW